MCEYCHQEYCCIHGRHHHYYYPRFPYPPAHIDFYERPSPETRREYLVEEKKFLEKRLKEIEDSLEQTVK